MSNPSFCLSLTSICQICCHCLYSCAPGLVDFLPFHTPFGPSCTHPWRMRCTGPSYALWLLVVSILNVKNLVSGSSVNRTIDDVHGDSATGALPQYLPEVPASEGPLWFNQTSCAAAGCAAAGVPDASLAFDNTWTAALYLADIGSMSITLKFSGASFSCTLVVNRLPAAILFPRYWHFCLLHCPEFCPKFGSRERRAL